MLRYFISSCFLLCLYFGQAQEEPLEVQAKDSMVRNEKYGLRVGIDLSRPTISYFEPEYTGLEFVGDYRISYKLYLAAELGNENRDRQEDLFNFTTTGSYIKLGVDYNTYGNWYGEQNLIYIGGRYAFSSFSQTLNNNQIFDSNRYWNPNSFAEGSNGPQEFGGLSASWIEFVLGVKTELIANIYMGGSLRMGFLITNKDPENFKNLFIPGFNKVTDGARFGIGYNFSISYFIPFYKKAKKAKKPPTQTIPQNEEN